jgi:hypothetical protein
LHNLAAISSALLNCVRKDFSFKYFGGFAAVLAQCDYANTAAFKQLIDVFLTDRKREFYQAIFQEIKQATDERKNKIMDPDTFELVPIWPGSCCLLDPRFPPFIRAATATTAGPQSHRLRPSLAASSIPVSRRRVRVVARSICRRKKFG